MERIRWPDNSLNQNLFVVSPMLFYSECKTAPKEKRTHYVLHSPYKNFEVTTVIFLIFLTEELCRAMMTRRCIYLSHSNPTTGSIYSVGKPSKVKERRERDNTHKRTCTVRVNIRAHNSVKTFEYIKGSWVTSLGELCSRTPARSPSWRPVCLVLN